jgi:hypothetical protein
MNNKFLNNTSFITVLLILAVSCQLSLAAERKGKQPGPPTMAPIGNIFMQPNNINTVFRTDGIFNYDKITFTSADAGMIWPVTASARRTINFTSGLWVGAQVNGQIRTAVAAFDSHFQPGNIPVIGQVPGQSVCNDPRFRAYYVQLTDPNLFEGGTVTKIAGGRTYTFTYDSWANWPVDMGAPYVEVNGIPGYQPSEDGDRPGIGNSEARPDEILFMVYMDYTNCTNNLHAFGISLPGNTPPIGVEVQQLSFAFNGPGLTDMYFVKWKIINKSANRWDSTYVSVFDDADVGNAFDDAVGCDTANNIGFVYNADNDDPQYGAAPPAIGYKYLQSPIVYTGNPQDTAHLPSGNLIGYLALGLTGFNYFTNGNPDACLNDPDEYIAGYNFMKGLDGCGRTKLNPISGQPTLFSYDGDACVRTGWFDSSSRDVRFMQNSGPFTMQSGDTQTVVMGCFVGKGGSNIQSLCALINNSNRVQRLYDLNFRSIPLPPAPQVSATAIGDGKITLYWGNISEAYDQFDVIDLTGSWKFQGYEIYQIKPGTGGNDEDERRLLAIYDLKDSITTVFDSLEVLQPNGETQIEVKPTALGTNSGISRHISLSQNAFPSGVNNFFINGQSYKFAVVSYAVNVNALRPSKVLKNQISSQIIDVIPNNPLIGSNFVNRNLDTLVSNRVDRGFSPIVIDPTKVISARYQQVYRSDTSYSIVRIINNSQVDTIIRNAVNVDIRDNNAFIIDGLMFKADSIRLSNIGVIRDPQPGAQTSATGWTYTGSTVNFAGVDSASLAIYPTGSFRRMQNQSMGISWPTINTFKSAFNSAVSYNFIKTYSLKRVKITFGQTQKAYRYRGAVNNSPYQDYVDVPFKVEIDDPLDTNGTPRQVSVAFYDGDSSGTWNPKAQSDGGLEFVYIMYGNYSETPSTFYTTKNINFAAQFRQMDVLYVWRPKLLNNAPAFQNGDVLTITPYTQYRHFQTPGMVTVTEVNTTAPTIGSNELAQQRGELSSVRVVPNPYYGGHYQETSPFDRFVKFMNMPRVATIYIYSLNGNLVRQIQKDDNGTTINWDLLNTDRIPIASGIYIAFIDAPGIGTKTIKLAIFTPEERLDSF